MAAFMKELTGTVPVTDLGLKATIATVDLISSAADRASTAERQTASPFDFLHFKDAIAYIMQKHASEYPACYGMNNYCPYCADS
jgi:hypothetical protein